MARLKYCPEDLRFVEAEVQEYDVPGLDLDGPRVLDIGGNVGAFAVWAVERWPGATVYSYEPHPRCFDFLDKNAADIGSRAIRAAVLGEDDDGKRMTLHAAVNDGGLCLSSMQGLYVSHDQIEVEVMGAHRLPECDVLKIDTEGSELPILRSYRHLRGCSYVAVEWHRPEEETQIAGILELAGLVHYHTKRNKNGTVGVLRYVSKTWAASLPEAPRSDPRPHLMICTPGWKHSPFYSQSIEALVLAASAQNVDLTIHREPMYGIERARNVCTELFRATPTAHCLAFIDSDIGAYAEDILAASRMIYEGKLHLIGAAYPKKAIDFPRVHDAVKRGEPAGRLHQFMSDLVLNVDDPDKVAGMIVHGRRMMMAKHVGTGFLFLSRHLLESYIEAYGPEISYQRNYPVPNDPGDKAPLRHHAVWKHEMDPGSPREAAKRALLSAAERALPDLEEAAEAYRKALREERDDPTKLPIWLTEDYHFCTRAKALGFQPWAMTDTMLLHQGPNVFAGRIGAYFEPVGGEQAAEAPKEAAQ